MAARLAQAPLGAFCPRGDGDDYRGIDSSLPVQTET
jgi:hypothetical protein